jgi:hypothetical protein
MDPGTQRIKAQSHHRREQSSVDRNVDEFPPRLVSATFQFHLGGPLLQAVAQGGSFK